MSKSSQNQREAPQPEAQPDASENSKGLSILAAQIEAVLFLSTSPVSEGELKEVFDVPASKLTEALRELEDHLMRGHGLILKALAGGWVLETNPHFAEILSRFRDAAQKRQVRLSRAAVETMAVIAYNQPVTRSEVEELRGTRSDGVIANLLKYGLVRLAGRRKGSGSPLLYRTTPRFLEVFGLDAIADLPSLEELGELGMGPVEGTEEGASPPDGNEQEPNAAPDDDSVGSAGMDGGGEANET